MRINHFLSTSRLLPGSFSSRAFAVLAFSVLAGCAQLSPDVSKVATPSVAVGNETDPLYWVMVAEVAADRQDQPAAVEAYTKAAGLSDDPAVAERATELALLSGDLESALSTARRWVSLDPSSVGGLRSLTLLYLHAGKIDEAKQALTRLIDSSPGKPQEGWMLLQQTLSAEMVTRAGALNMLREMRDQYSNLAAAQYVYAGFALAVGSLEESLIAVNQAERLAPNWTQVKALKVRVLQAQGKKPEAMQAILAALKSYPNDPALRLTYAKILIETQDFKRAGREFQKVLDLDQDNPEALYALGLLAMDEERYSEARRNFLQLLKTGQRRFDACYHLGVLDTESGNNESALEWLGQVQGGQFLFPAQIQIADVLARLGRMETSRLHLKQLRERNPQLALPLYLAEGELLLTHGQAEDSVAIYNEAAQTYPDDRRLRYGRALAADRVGDVVLAEEDLRFIIDQFPEDAEALNAFGYMLIERTDRLGEAKNLIERALTLRPDNAAIMDSMGWVYFKLGKYKQAKQYLQQAYQLDKDPEIAAHWGELLWTLGRRDEARRIIEQARQRAPDNESLNEVIERLKGL